MSRGVLGGGMTQLRIGALVGVYGGSSQLQFGSQMLPGRKRWWNHSQVSFHLMSHVTRLEAIASRLEAIPL